MISTPWPSVTQLLEGLGHWWYATKTVAEHALGFSNDALHVLVGVVLQLALARLMTVSIGQMTPWLGVLALELLNEWSDLSFEIWPDPAMQWGESVKDVLLTMALPSILLIVSRRWPDLLRRPERSQCSPAETPEAVEPERFDT